MSSFFYFIKESLKGFTRNLSTALGSIVTIFLSLLIIGVFLVGGFVVEKLVSSVESEVSITAYVSDDASDADIQSVENFIEGLDGVASVGFTNKEQALEKFRSSTTSDIIDTLDGQNPLPRSIDVELSDPQLVEQVADAIRGNSTYQQIIGYDTPEQSLKYGQQTVDRLFTLTNYVRYIGIALVAHLHRHGVHQQHHPPGHSGAPQGNRHHAPRGRVERLHPRALPHGRRAARHHRLAFGGGLP